MGKRGSGVLRTRAAEKPSSRSPPTEIVKSKGTRNERNFALPEVRA